MQYKIFHVNFPFIERGVDGFALKISNTDELYQAYKTKDLETFISIDMEDVFFKIIELNHLEDDLESGFMVFEENEDDITFYIIEDKGMPQPFISHVSKMLIQSIKAQEQEWINLDEERNVNYDLNVYQLEKLTSVFSLPYCTGTIFQNEKGTYFLQTPNILDDFLDLKSSSDINNCVVIIEDIRTLWDYLEERE